MIELMVLEPYRRPPSIRVVVQGVASPWAVIEEEEEEEKEEEEEDPESLSVCLSHFAFLPF